jgi:hypothetical protein
MKDLSVTLNSGVSEAEIRRFTQNDGKNKIV